MNKAWVVGTESIEVTVGGVEVYEGGEEIASDDVRQGSCVFVFVEDFLSVQRSILLGGGRRRPNL